MKKNLVLFAALTIACTYALADTYTYSVRRNPSYDQPSDSYYLDRKLQEQKEKSDPLSVGLLTRFGYAFNYDAFTYGVSFFYQWSRIAGITAGFDGYYIPNKHIEPFKMTPYLHRLSRFRYGIYAQDL